MCSDRLEDFSAFDAADFIQRHKRRAKKRAGKKQKSRAMRQYVDVVCAFDIETSQVAINANGDPESVMYIWQFQAGLECTYIGRTWDDFRILVSRINNALEDLQEKTDRDWRLVVYVHNLSFEFQFLAGIFDFTPDAVFAVKSRKVLKCDLGKIEFRDSLLHSNMKLEEYCKKMRVAHQKLAGDLDYSIVRYPWTPLTDQELAYCVNDVRGLVECIYTEMQVDGDDLYTIPLTSTGYVRRDAKNAMACWGLHHVRDLLPDYECYTALREAFRGGDTHANRYYVGITLEDVHSIDMSSAYPGVQLECRFPMSPFRKETSSINSLKTALTRGRACIIRIAFFNLRLKHSWWGFPYCALAKTRHARNFVNDNGRLLSAEYLETTITDIDFAIFSREYDWDAVTVIDLWTSRYGELPKKLQEVVREYYTAKTTLKDVLGQEVQYMKSKNKLNSVYGMTAQDPVKLDTVFTGSEWVEGVGNPEEVYAESCKHAFLPYQWGVWTTALTRLRLKVAQHAAGRNGVYCDTDSVKYVGDIDMEEYNRNVQRIAKDRGACAKDPKGKTHYMGVFEVENSYAEFKTWGAKKYACTYERGGKITTTIAGVNKKLGGQELAANGGLDAFRPGFVFRDAASKRSVYNDSPEISKIYVDGKELAITRNVSIVENTYELGITQEYAAVLGLKLEEIVC